MIFVAWTGKIKVHTLFVFLGFVQAKSATQPAPPARADFCFVLSLFLFVYVCLVFHIRFFFFNSRRLIFQSFMCFTGIVFSGAYSSSFLFFSIGGGDGKRAVSRPGVVRV